VYNVTQYLFYNLDFGIKS